MVVLLVLFLMISAFLAGSETALFSLSSLKVKVFKQDHRHLVATLLEKPKELLVTILIVNIAVNILVQNIISNIFAAENSWLLSVGLPLLLVLFFGEAVPKSIAISHNQKISSMAAPILYGLRIIVSPIRVVLTKLSAKLSRICFFFLRKEPEISHAELKHALTASQERGIIHRDELRLINGSFKMDETLVKGIMTDRTEILYYSIHEPIKRLIDLFIEEECTQIPVIDGSFDTVLGIITSASFFVHRDVRLALKKPLYVPETISARKLLANFHQASDTIALVVDEYGQVSGLVTKEDIVELVIGQIEDKRDDEALYTKQGEDVIICSGKLEIAALEEIFDVPFESDQSSVTVGGFLTEQLGDIPKSGSKVQTPQFLFHVLAASKSRVNRVYVRRIYT